jgi:hypothetical protein
MNKVNYDKVFTNFAYFLPCSSNKVYRSWCDGKCVKWAFAQLIACIIQIRLCVRTSCWSWFLKLLYVFLLITVFEDSKCNSRSLQWNMYSAVCVSLWISLFFLVFTSYVVWSFSKMYGSIVYVTKLPLW